MSDVYANSYCTIAATSAKDSSEGCLGKREFPRPVEFHEKSLLRSFWLSDCGNFDQDVNAEPLNTRAWVLQERILAPRTLHYTSHQLFWECMTLTEPEDGSMNTVDRKHNFLPDFAPGDKSLHDIPPSWYYLIEEYSRLDMTFAKDKLIAISGLVNRLQSRVISDYHFGLWSGEIHKGLCWLPADQKLKPALQWRAPSWSWAAYDGNMQYYQDAVGSSANMDMEFLSCSSTMGSLSDSVLNIRTNIRELLGVGPVVPREDLVPVSLAEYSTCYSLLDVEGETIGWFCLDTESEAPNIHEREILSALVSSCEIPNNGFGNKFLFGTLNDLTAGCVEHAEEVEETLEGEGFADFHEDDTDELHCDDQQHNAEEWDENDGFDQDETSDTMTASYVLILEPLGNANFRRIGFGVLTDRDWIEDGERNEIRVE